MGMVSFAIADAARDAGAVLAAGVPVARVLPGEGVVLEDGTSIDARTVICNADPKVALRLLAPRTPVEVFYFCGAATHPGGSVIALNGRNAAEAVLADSRVATS